MDSGEGLPGRAGGRPTTSTVMVGTPDAVAVHDACLRVGDQVGREDNPTIMTPDELREHSGFLDQVRRNATVPVTGDIPWP